MKQIQAVIMYKQGHSFINTQKITNFDDSARDAANLRYPFEAGSLKKLVKKKKLKVVR